MLDYHRQTIQNMGDELSLPTQGCHIYIHCLAVSNSANPPSGNVNYKPVNNKDMTITLLCQNSLTHHTYLRWIDKGNLTFYCHIFIQGLHEISKPNLHLPYTTINLNK